MNWLEKLFIPLSVGGLLFWPVYQALTRRWSDRARRLLTVFLGTAVVLLIHASLVWVP
jgi:drug/metabolite transporter (DMT)-like permease